MMPAATCDVAVVGAGHNGLTAACYLQRAGLAVTVLEKNDFVGGMAASRPFISEAPDHIVSPGAYENAFLRTTVIPDELDLGRHGYRDLEGFGWAWLGDDGESIVLRRDLEASITDMARYSRADAATYREFIEITSRLAEIQGRLAASIPGGDRIGALASMAKLVTSRKLRRTFADLAGGTAAEVIEGTFESDQVRGLFAHLAVVIWGGLRAEGSALGLLSPALLHNNGTGRPVGGMGGVTAALERALLASGGEVRLGATVTKVVTDGERVGGLELQDGSQVVVREGILTALAPQRIPELVPDLDSSSAAGLGAAPANAGGVAALTASLALNGKLQLPGHERDDLEIRKPLLFRGGYKTVIDAWDESARGEIPRSMPWWAAIFSAVDSSQAPEGQDVIQLYSPVPVHPHQGWAAARNEAAEQLIDQAGEAIAGLRELEIGRFVETPDDLSARTGAENGCLYHVDHMPSRLGPLRPAHRLGEYRTPLAGLYITGAGTHPNGGVSGLPGKHAATTIIRDRGRTKLGFG